MTYVKDKIVTSLLVVYAAPLWVILLGLIGACFALAMGVAIHLREKAKLIAEHKASSDKLLG